MMCLYILINTCTVILFFASKEQNSIFCPNVVEDNFDKHKI